MSSLLLSLLEETSRNVQIGLPTNNLTVCASGDDLDRMIAHFKASGGEIDDFLVHSLDVAQFHLMEQSMVLEEVDKFVKEYWYHVDPQNHNQSQLLITPPDSMHDDIVYGMQESLLPLSNSPTAHHHHHRRSPTFPKYITNEDISSPNSDHGHMMGGGTKKRQNFPREVTQVLMDWLITHFDHPYPSEQEKEMLGQKLGLKVSQISGWFINARRRKLKKDPNTNTFNLFKTK